MWSVRPSHRVDRPFYNMNPEKNNMKINEIIEYCWYHASKSYLWSGEDDIYPFRGAALIFGTILLNILTVITVINIIYGIDLFWIGKVQMKIFKP